MFIARFVLKIIDVVILLLDRQFQHVDIVLRRSSGSKESTVVGSEIAMIFVITSYGERLRIEMLTWSSWQRRNPLEF